MAADTVAVNFSMNRELYNEYKQLVLDGGENVKGNLVRYMQSVVHYQMTNPSTIAAIEEVERLKKDPNKKTYGSFAEAMEDLGE